MSAASKPAAGGASPTPPLQFRVWHKGRNRYTRNSSAADDGTYDGSDLCLSPDGRLHYCDDGNGPRDLDRLSDWVVEPDTGLSSAVGQPVYLNDVVRFTYAVGDLAWEGMDEAETRVQERMSGRPFMGAVVWSLSRFEIDCPLGADPLSPAMRFPASYAGGAEILGSVNEHPDWRAKWLPDYSWLRGEKGAS